MLKSLRVKNFRNIADQKIEFSRGTNVIYGGNGEGKTSLFEAMYISSYLKSFVGAKDKYLVNNKNDFFFIEAEFENDFFSSVSFFSDIKKRVRTLRVDGVIFRKLSQYYGKNNITIFSVHDVDIVNISENKKEFINHVSSIFNFEYITLYSQYKLLITRKKNLFESVKKDGSKRQYLSKTLDSLNNILSDYCAKISQIKAEALDLFLDLFEKNRGTYFPEYDIKIEYDSCVCKKLWQQNFFEKKDKEIEQSMVLGGVHKENMSIYFNGMDIAKNSSEGQKKITAFLLKISEAEFIQRIKKNTPILIFDDLNSAIDNKNLDKLITAVRTFKNSQVFVSFTNKELIPKELLREEHKIIEVKNGEYF